MGGGSHFLRGSFHQPTSRSKWVGETDQSDPRPPCWDKIPIFTEKKVLRASLSLGPERDLWPLNYFGYEWLFMRKMLKTFLDGNQFSFYKLFPDIFFQVVAALGDSITAGVGARANSVLDIFTEYRYSIYSLIYSQNTGTHSQLLIHS